MTGLNLHNIAGDALAFLNPYKEMIFTKVRTVWTKDSRTPDRIEETVTVKGKMQPANLQQLAEMGFDLREYQYFRVFLSLDATQLDRIRQLSSDTFICEGRKYRVVAREEWYDNAGWNEIFCYLDEVTNAGK